MRIDMRLILAFVCFSTGVFAQAPWSLNEDGSTTIEAERPIQVVGRTGLEKRAVASRGEVLGAGWGSDSGDFAELFFRTPEALKPARIRFHYARPNPGDVWLDLILDSVPLGRVRLHSTGGDGTAAEDFTDVTVDIGQLKAGYHRLYVTVVADGMTSARLKATRQASNRILDRIGNRSDKTSIGHGKNIALYTGRGTSKRCFYATHELGNIFSAADGETILWHPDHALLEGNSQRPEYSSEVFIDTVTFEAETGQQLTPERTNTLQVVEQRQVCVTKDDVIVSRILVENQTEGVVTHTIHITGDCTRSFDWREQPGGERQTMRQKNRVVMVDHSVFPNALPDGLNMAIGASTKPSKIDTDTPGAYRMQIDIRLQPGETQSVVCACAFERSAEAALKNLESVLSQPDPIAANREAWTDFYTRQVPQFDCSDPGLTELYGFRWFLLRFSTAGGDLGFFKHPVVMEGRQAYQTYCCYSAPFMALDMNWAVDPNVGFGHIANMAYAAYEDGRFPWYTSPRTNKVKLDHASRSGLSLLPHTAWRHYQIHGDKRLMAELYPAMAKNCDWWITDRDPNRDGLFDVAHQLETGQDDLFRWGHENREMRYDAVDATSYALLNLRATANIARTLGKQKEAQRLQQAADRSAAALDSVLWSSDRTAWFDRHQETRKLATDYLAITTFYPFFAGVGDANKVDIFRQHLLNEDEFWKPHPVPALPASHPDYGPTKFWEGPSWPAATSHVVEAFAHAAKTYDRSLLPQAGHLLRRAAANHLQPRADFFERYNPETGDGLSLFRDYMHSWWIDVYLRHIVGLQIADDGSATIDPLPMNLKHYRARNIPFRGQLLDISWSESDGLTVIAKTGSDPVRQVVSRPNFKPGDAPVLLKL